MHLSRLQCNHSGHYRTVICAIFFTRSCPRFFPTVEGGEG